MTNMEQPHILYDSQIFDLQKFGGISRYFCEIISKLGMAYDISVRFTENHYLAQAKLARHRIHAPHFFFKHYKKRLLLENQTGYFKRHLLIFFTRPTTILLSSSILVTTPM